MEHREQLLPLLIKLKQDMGEQLSNFVTPFKFEKNHYLLHEGEISKHIWLLKEGVAHLFYIREDQSITCNFFFPCEFICSYPSLVWDCRSLLSIQLLTDSSGWCIDSKNLENIRSSFPLIDKLEEKIVACYLNHIEQLEIRLRGLNAQEHYQFLIDHHREYIQQIPLIHIASYLGINPGSLSRIRGNN